jgi:hypothetical protein
VSTVVAEPGFGTSGFGALARIGKVGFVPSCGDPPRLTGPAGAPRAGGAVATDIDVTTDLLTETYQTHYTSLLRLAALLLDDLGSCEDVVQEAFIRVHAARSRVREPW